MSSDGVGAGRLGGDFVVRSLGGRSGCKSGVKPPHSKQIPYSDSCVLKEGIWIPDLSERTRPSMT